MLASDEEATAQHYRALQALKGTALASVRRGWQRAQPDPHNLQQRWQGLLENISATLAEVKTAAVAEGERHAREILSSGGRVVLSEGRVRAPFLVWNDAEGRPMARKLNVPVSVVEQALEAGRGGESAMRAGRRTLEQIVASEVADAARLAEGITIAASTPTDGFHSTRALDITDPEVLGWSTQQRRDYFGEDYDRQVRERAFGWVRVLNPPSCDRCIVLADTWYGWNDGFERHPNCDCFHRPADELEGDRHVTDPFEYFEQLSEQEQNAVFGKANAQAIRDGADLRQVVNLQQKARTGGVYDSTRGGRLTPEAIYQQAASDRLRALELLREEGYLTEEVLVRRSAQIAPALPPRPPQNYRDRLADESALSPDERLVLEAYVENGLDYNQALREAARAGTQMSPAVETDVSALDRVLQRNALPADATVIREVSAEVFGIEPDQANQLAGRVFRDAAYLSTTVNDEPLPLDTQNPIILELVVPRGTPAAYLAPVAPGELAAEGELLLGRGLTMRLDQARFDEQMDRWVVRAFVQPPD